MKRDKSTSVDEVSQFNVRRDAEAIARPAETGTADHSSFEETVTSSTEEDVVAIRMPRMKGGRHGESPILAKQPQRGFKAYYSGA